MKNYFVTYFDRNYLAKGLALIESLKEHETKDFTIFVICLDEITRILLNKLAPGNIVAIPLDAIERADFPLLNAKKTRSTVEYYWTLTPTIILRILEKYPEVDVLTYLDADLFFYAPTDAIYAELGDASVLIHEHRYSETLAHLEKMSGRFNVGLLCFRNDGKAKNVLLKWREQCLEWCYYRFEEGRMGDQMYLDKWPEEYDCVRILENVGAGLAPWNHAKYDIEAVDNEVMVNEKPLVFYHFHAFCILPHDLVVPLKHVHYPVVRNVNQYIVIPYLGCLFDIKQKIQDILPEFEFGFSDELELSPQHTLFVKNSDVSTLGLPQKEYSHMVTGEWTVLIPSTENSSGQEASRETGRGAGEEMSQEHVVSIVEDNYKAEEQLLDRLNPGEGLKNYIERSYIADNLQNIFFVGVHLFEERNWFFSVFNKLQKLVLFEPLPNIHQQLVKEFGHVRNIEILPYVVSDSNGQVTFHITNNLYSSSVLPLKEHKQIFPSVEKQMEIQVEQVTLDHVIESKQVQIPDLLYIDVQGAEYMVLKGLDRSRLKEVKVIYTEASTIEMYEGAKLLDDIIEYLKDDFIFLGFEDMMNTKVHGDALFVNRRFVKELKSRNKLALEYNHKGEQAAEAGDMQASNVLFEKALSLWPYAAVIHNNLAVVAWQNGDIANAISHLKNGLQVEPNNEHILRNLTEIESVVSQAGGGESTRSGDDHTPDVRNRSVPEGEEPGNPLKKIRLSALVSTYKSAEFIAECLDDLEGQTIADQIEIIVIDADSPENEGEIVSRYQQRFDNIKYIRTDTRIGIYAAWNLAIREAQGEFLISCSTNDRLEKNACEKLMQELDSDPDIALVYGNSYLTRTAHETFENHTAFSTYTWPEFSFSELLKSCLVGPHPMWRRSLHDEIGFFDEKYLAIGDQDFWLRIGEKYKLKHVNYYTTLHWVTSDSLSGNANVSIAETEEIHRKYQARNEYRSWLHNHTLEEVDGQIIAERMMKQWTKYPSIHLLCILENGEEEAIANTLDSLGTQFYKGWGLTVIGNDPERGALFDGLDNVEWIQAGENYADTINSAIEATRADWIGLIEAGDTLEPNILYSFADIANEQDDVKFIYCDHDHIENDGTTNNPHFKPDFNLDMLRSMQYMGNLCLVERETLENIGGVEAFPYLELHDVAFKVYETYGADAISHIQDILFHKAKQGVRYSDEMLKLVVQNHLQRSAVPADVQSGYLPNTCRVLYRHDTSPLVSIIIPTRNKVEHFQPCIESVLDKTRYPNYEIIIVDNQSDDPDILRYFDELVAEHTGKVRVLKYPKDFNYAAIINLAAREAQGEYILQLNNDTRVMQAEWLDRLMSHAQRPEVGAVGARLTYPGNGKIQHAGIVLGMEGVADHPFCNAFSIRDPGYMNRLQVDQNYSAVTGACLLLRKQLFNEVGCMDEEGFKVSYNDVDLCLKIIEKKYLIVWTPYVTLVHSGNISQAEASKDPVKYAESCVRFRNERHKMLKKWLPQLASDPAYNRNLKLTSRDMQVEASVVTHWNTSRADRPRIIGIPVTGGSGEYRVRSPLRALSSAGLAQCEWSHVLKLNEQRILTVVELERIQADTLIMQNGLGDEHIKVLSEYKEYNKAMLVYALDDLVTNLPDANSFKKDIPLDAKYRLRKSLRSCDRLYVTTEPLVELCSDMIDDIRLIPNYLEGHLWENVHSERRVGRKPRIGWAGAQQHAGDLQLIEEVVRQTAGEVEWIFFGMCPENLKPYLHEVHEFELSFEAYPEKLASLNLDLAIAPLEKHPFNEAKSNLRLLEYGMMGWPVICTDILPYQNAPVKRVNNTVEEWLEAIRERIHDLDAAAREGDILQKWVQDNYILENNLDIWLDALTPGSRVSAKSRKVV